jgi:GntR family transcriptional regulator, transcriptional repressor for pyruvate dehydrogenase complex
MADLLRVSRPSLREAVRILEARGRLTVKHGQGVFVQAPLSERELRAAMGDINLSLRELYAMREVLEVPAAGWAAENMTPELLRDVRKALDALNAAGEAVDPDYDAVRQLDANFHLAIAVAAGNRFLRQTSNVLHNMVRSSMQTTLLVPGRVAISRRDHERIYAALERHDVAGARQAARAHVRGARAAAARLLDDEGRDERQRR